MIGRAAAQVEDGTRLVPVGNIAGGRPFEEDGTGAFHVLIGVVRDERFRDIRPPHWDGLHVMRMKA